MTSNREMPKSTDRNIERTEREREGERDRERKMIEMG